MLPPVCLELLKAGAVLAAVLSAEAEAADEKSIEELVPIVDLLSLFFAAVLRCPILPEPRLGKGSFTGLVLSGLWSFCVDSCSFAVAVSSAISSVSASPSLSAPGPTASAIRSLVRLLPPNAAGMNAFTLGGSLDRIALIRPGAVCTS